MQNSQPRLAISNLAFRELLQERHCMWLPVPLPAHSEPVPIDVAVWLFELRHYSDSNDVPCDSRGNLDYDSTANSSCELDTEETQEPSLQKCDEIKQNCQSEVQEYPSNSENSSPKEDIPGLLIQEEDCVKIHSQEEAKNCHCDIQEHPGEDNPGLLIQKKEVSVDSTSKKEEVTLNCCCQCLENSAPREGTPGLLIQKEEVSVESTGKNEEVTLNCCCYCLENSAPREDTPGLLIQKEEIFVENLGKGKDIQKCHCECSDNVASIEDIPGLQQTQWVNIRSHKCDCGDLSSFKIYSCIVQGNGIVNTDEDNQKEYEQQVSEPPSSSQALKYNSILWEANPLYCGVGVEGNGGVFRKLCHNASELGSSIHVGSGEESGLGSSETSEPVTTSFTDDCGVVKTGCSVHQHGTFSSKFGSEVRSNCFSLGEEACTETCRYGTDLSADIRQIDSCVSGTTSSVTNVNKITAKDYRWEATQNVQFCHSVESDIHDLVTGVSNTGSNCDKAFDCHPTSEYLEDSDGQLVSCVEKYKEVLHHLELTIQNLVVATGDISDDREMEPDADFLKLCQEAQNLAEEASQQCSAEINSKRIEARSITLSSDLSDDVFTSSPSSDNVMHPLPPKVHRRYNLDINSIFDDGSKPPVPPARKKRNKETSKTLHITEEEIVDETKVFDAASDTCLQRASHSDATELSVKDTDNENSLLDCQELLIIERVAESTKEKRNVKVASHYEDRNLYSLGCDAHQCVPDCDSMNVAIVSGIHSQPSLNDRDSESFVPDDIVIRKPDECDEYLNIVLTRTRPISSTEFPPSEQQIHNTCENKLSSESVSVGTICAESGILLQNRKGSTSSDIAVWKQELQHSGLYYLDDEWDADCMLQPDQVGHIFTFVDRARYNSFLLVK
jgi:hypothetical protein